MSDGIRVTVASYGEGRCLMMTYIDPTTGKKRARTSGTSDRREAERAAGVWEDELNSGRYCPPSRLTWSDFRTRYEAERLATMSASYRRSAGSAFNCLERLLDPGRLAALNTAAMSRFVAKLRQEKIREATRANYLRSIRAALRWAKRMGMLAAVPEVDMPKAGEAKGRAVTTEEFERMLAVVPKVRPKDSAAWDHYLRGLWLSGLRLQESLVVSWEPDAPFRVDLSGKFPCFAIEAKAQKGRRSERVPMMPDCAEFLLSIPPAQRHGRVFKLPSLRDGQPISATKTSLIVTAIGSKAGVVVAKDPDTGKVKYASAHDLRRGYASRWARKTVPIVLKTLMRHRSVATTEKYYVSLNTDELAAELWAKHGAAGNTDGNTRPESAPADGTAQGATQSSPRA